MCLNVFGSNVVQIRVMSAIKFKVYNMFYVALSMGDTILQLIATRFAEQKVHLLSMAFDNLQWRGITPKTPILLELKDATHNNIVPGLNTVPADKTEDLDAHFLVVPASEVWHCMDTCGQTKNLWTAEIPPDAIERVGKSYNKVVALEKLTIVEAILSAMESLDCPNNYLPESEDLMTACFVFGCEEGIVFAPSAKCSDVDFMLSFMRYFQCDAIGAMSDEMRSNKEIAKLCLSMFPEHLNCFPSSIRDDREIAELVLHDSASWEDISDRLKDDLSFVLKGIEVGGHYFFEYASERLQASNAAVNDMLLVDGYVLQHLNEQMRDNPSFVAAAMRTKPDAFQFAGQTIKGDADKVHDIVARLGNDFTDEHVVALLNHVYTNVTSSIMQMYHKTAIRLMKEGLAATSTKRKRSDD